MEITFKLYNEEILVKDCESSDDVVDTTQELFRKYNLTFEDEIEAWLMQEKRLLLRATDGTWGWSVCVEYIEELFDEDWGYDEF